MAYYHLNLLSFFPYRILIQRIHLKVLYKRSPARTSSEQAVLLPWMTARPDQRAKAPSVLASPSHEEEDEADFSSESLSAAAAGAGRA